MDYYPLHYLLQYNDTTERLDINGLAHRSKRFKSNVNKITGLIFKTVIFVDFWSKSKNLVTKIDQNVSITLHLSYLNRKG